VSRARSARPPERPRLVEAPLLAALRAAGTRHVWADSADVDEVRALLDTGGGILREVDGNTANQPLVRKVVGRYVAGGEPRAWARELEAAGARARGELGALVYAILCARIGNDMAAAFGAGRAWETSLQLHMGLVSEPERARRVGRLQRRMAPGGIVKVPFAPDAPDCLLVARDLERAGVPVNFTSTFSARQAVVAALFANVARTNVFMGRLNQGFEAKLLGEHVDLEAQRALARLRREDGVRTELIVASLREWRSLVRVAGCDVFTVPCAVLRDFLEQDEIGPEAIEPRLETSYEDALGVSDEITARVGADRIARLFRVEPELIAFLREIREADVAEGAALARRFEEAGFGDLFHVPTRDERDEIERDKLPRRDGTLLGRIAPDTHMSLLANADFARAQREIDAELERHLDGIR
jgi:transaldolase